MSMSRIKTLATAGKLETYVKSFDFKEVDSVSDIGDMSFSHEFFAGSRYEQLHIVFGSFQESLQYMFSDFTASEIKSIDSMLQFYLRLFPYKTLLDLNNEAKTTASMHKRDDSFKMNFELFSIAYRYDGWIFQINDKFAKDRPMTSMNFVGLQMAIISAFHAMFTDIFMSPSLVIDNTLVKRVADNQTNFDFSTMRFASIFKHESDMDFAQRIKKFGNFKVFGDLRNKRRVVNRDEICVSGNKRVDKNILDVTKLKETHVSIHNESPDLLDYLFEGTFNPEEFYYFKKTLALMTLADRCYPRQRDNEYQIIRANNSKKTVFNLISERCPFQIRTGRHGISISAFISVGFYIEDKYTSLKVSSFEEAYKDCYAKLVKHVAATLDIEPEDVTELHFKTLEMSNY